MDISPRKRDRNSMDRLPDELLISIVSRLPLKEAGRTSVVARRWRNIWKFIKNLNFDGSEKLGMTYSVEVERQGFVDWVNRVVSLHSGKIVGKFHVCFHLNRNHGDDIDSWIEFALRKKVKILNLRFQCQVMESGWYTEPQIREVAYIFPNITRYLPFTPSLKSLNLSNMVIIQECLDSFMANCPTLRQLHLKNIMGFAIFRLNRLTCLGLGRCRDLERIETNPNRVSSLTYLMLSVASSAIFLSRLDELSGCLSQLKTLALIIKMSVEIKKKCQRLPRLKKLDLQIYVQKEAQILNFVDVMMNAAPLLHEMVLTIAAVKSVNTRPRYPPRRKYKHWCLETVKIRCGEGITAGEEVALYLLEFAPELHRMLIGGVRKNLYNLMFELMSRVSFQ